MDLRLITYQRPNQAGMIYYEATLNFTPKRAPSVNIEHSSIGETIMTYLLVFICGGVIFAFKKIWKV